MDTKSYLQRIKISKFEKPNLSFLSKLQEHHLLTVPFENLDIHQGDKIVLAENRIYEKIVVNERGGFCYELNGLFCWLLRFLDFSVSKVVFDKDIRHKLRDHFGIQSNYKKT